MTAASHTALFLSTGVTAVISGRLVMIASMTVIVGGNALTAPRPRG